MSLEALPDAALIVDRGGTVVCMNRSFGAMFGYGLGDVLGLPVRQLVSHPLDEDRNDPGRPGSAAAWRTTPHEESLTILAKNGQHVPVEIAFDADAQGTIVMIVRDVSRRQQLDRWRDEQIDCLAHDLKNPLAVMKLQSDRLARVLVKSGTRNENEIVRSVTNSVALLSRLVDEILELAYLRSPQVEICAEPVDLTAFVTAVLMQSITCPGRVSVESQAHPVAMIEARRIERVLVNLIENAIHHSPPEAPIVVRVEVKDVMAVVSVVDEGPGLTAQEASYVFEKFRRAPTAQRGAGAGLGLGLYISRVIVEAHRGWIGVESSPGHGATFHFTVPLEPRAATGSRAAPGR